MIYRYYDPFLSLKYPHVDCEANFLRLIEKLCNGCKIEINETGTVLKFVPGFVAGGKVEHTCATSKSIGWYLEGSYIYNDPC